MKLEHISDYFSMQIFSSFFTLQSSIYSWIMCFFGGERFLEGGPV